MVEIEGEGECKGDSTAKVEDEDEGNGEHINEREGNQLGLRASVRVMRSMRVRARATSWLRDQGRLGGGH